MPRKIGLRECERDSHEEYSQSITDLSYNAKYSPTITLEVHNKNGIIV